MVPTQVSFLHGNWGWEYGAVLCPMECDHGDWVAHCCGQDNQTRLKQIPIHLLISDSLQQFSAPAINLVIALPGTALLVLGS